LRTSDSTAKEVITMDNLSVEIFNNNSKGVSVDAGLSRTNRVFIPNKSGHNFNDSRRYGEPVYITTGEVNRFSVGYMARKWMASLFDSKPTDYILLTSLTILTVVGASIFGWLHGRINILLFRNNKYILRTVDFKELYHATLQNRMERKDETSYTDNPAT
jgi:hypothetical protein